MKRKQKDRHLDVPAEANRDKHINFVAVERSETDPRDEPTNGALADESDKRRNERNKNKKSKK